MGIDPFTLAIAAFATAAVGTAGSMYSQSKAASATQKAGEAQRRQEALAAAVQRRQQFKNYRVAAAQASQNAENQGVAQSSGAQGGQGSLRSQLDSNISFLDQQGQIADYAGRMFDRAAKWNTTAQAFSGVSQLALQSYSLSQNADFQKLFNKGP